MPALDAAVDDLVDLGLRRVEELDVLLALLAAPNHALSRAGLDRRAGATPTAVAACIRNLISCGLIAVRGSIVVVVDSEQLTALRVVALAVARDGADATRDSFLRAVQRRSDGASRPVERDE